MKRTILILVILALIAGGYFYFVRSKWGLRPGSRTDQSISGGFRGDQTWSGEILITGDVVIDGNLTVLAGTVVRFAVGDDQGTGEEIAADGFNDNDPTRLLAYEKPTQVYMLPES